MRLRSVVPLARAAALAIALSATPAFAQPSAYDADFLRDLPGSRDVFSLLETSEPLTIADRWDGGGLWTGEAGRLSARGASWTQTVFQLDGLDVSDPLVGGTPLVLPWHEALDSMDFAIGGARRDAVAPDRSSRSPPCGRGTRGGACSHSTAGWAEARSPLRHPWRGSTTGGGARSRRPGRSASASA